MMVTMLGVLELNKLQYIVVFLEEILVVYNQDDGLALTFLNRLMILISLLLKLNETNGNILILRLLKTQ